MAGRRLDVDSIGESYEVFAQSLLGRIATLTRIGMKEDFGTDTYCQPRISITARTEAVTELCLLQVKGGNSPLTYGGIDNKQEWKGYEFEWLKNLWAPLYVAKVDYNYQKVDLYSLWPVWWVMWQCGSPFKVTFSFGDASESQHTFSHPSKDAAADAVGMGDGHIWAVDLGPPFLRLTHEQLNNESFRNQAVEIFRFWIQVDRRIIANYHTNVPMVEAVHSWVTNHLPHVRQELLAMDGTPGKNIEVLAKALATPLTALGAHLQHQGNREAFRLIPILEWLESNCYGNLITPQLLEKLSLAQKEGVSPSQYL